MIMPYVTYKASLLYGKKLPYPDFAEMEEKWVLANSTYLSKVNPEGTIPVVEELHKRYYKKIEQAYLK